MKQAILIFLSLVFSSTLFSQEHQLEWEVRSYLEGEELKSHLSFEGASYYSNGVPTFTDRFDVPTSDKVVVELMGAQYAALTLEEVSALPEGWLSQFSASEAHIDQVWTEKDGEKSTVYQIIPFRRNAETGELEKLISFDVLPSIVPAQASFQSQKTTGWSQNSVLTSGKWIRTSVTSSGMFKVSVEDLNAAGLPVLGQPSAHLLAYHNGGGMLPEAIEEHRHDDLRQIAIRIEDGGDGILNSADMVYFYAEGPHAIEFNPSSQLFSHRFNVYEERTFVYFTFNAQQNGLRISTEQWTGGSATLTSTGFDDIKFHELDERNIIGTGREWYGEVFDFNLNRNYSFVFPNRLVNEEVRLTVKTAASASSTTRFNFVESGLLRVSSAVGASSGFAEFLTVSTTETFVSPSQNLSFSVEYDRTANPTATGYLDWIRVHARRGWQYSNGGFVARDSKVISPGEVVDYNVSNLSAWVWDVTDPTRPIAPERDATGSWKAHADSLRTYVVSTPGDATLLSSFSSVANQNLHGLDNVDMLIVAHPSFVNQAERLAQFHIDHDQLSVAVVTPGEIYHEFSGGTQDVTAIRDFVRMLYKRNTSNPLEYLLLFGDASYDYKDRVPNRENFVPIYESVNSNSLYTSFMTDDYYSCLDDMEGVNVVFELNDINVGRLPVKSAAEARNVVDKIIGYAVAEQSFGDWRNRITFVSDDVDVAWESILTREPEAVAQALDTLYPNFNIEKIYSDSYSQESTSGSQSYPAARDALYRSVERGNLVTAYTGHGGEVGWSSERLLQLQDVNNWTNGDKLPLFVTITCEFTRLDDPFRTSAGEQLFLNPNGGSVGLISTTRVVFVPGAVSLNRAVFENIFETENGVYPTLGDIVRRAKNKVNDADRIRFSLIGDPALRLNIPIHSVVVDSVNGKDISAIQDTMRAREQVTLKGRVLYNTGSLFSDFNGEVYITVFDKAVERTTKRNDGVGAVVSFTLQDNIAFKGRASVKDGFWEASFIVPRDINYTFAEGKISLYADNDEIDAGGAERRFIVGGLGTSPIADDLGPEIRLFMNDTNFVNGGITDDSPTGLALVYDESGINVVGSGIGHNIIGVLDGNENEPISLNSSYEADIDTYTSGRVEYPFINLSDGNHTLKVRVWDVLNNVNEATVRFVVAERDNLVIEDLFNYPNPFTESTTFSFEHNRANEGLDVQLHIIDQTGRLVHFESKKLTPEGNRTLDMTWDATDGDGKKVSSGIYVFRVVVRSLADGSEASESERLVFLK